MSAFSCFFECFPKIEYFVLLFSKLYGPISAIQTENICSSSINIGQNTNLQSGWESFLQNNDRWDKMVAQKGTTAAKIKVIYKCVECNCCYCYWKRYTAKLNVFSTNLSDLFQITNDHQLSKRITNNKVTPHHSMDTWKENVWYYKECSNSNYK